MTCDAKSNINYTEDLNDKLPIHITYTHTRLPPPAKKKNAVEHNNFIVKQVSFS